MFMYKHKGSYTIELSLIMPIILGVIMLCLYMTVYVHDRVVMEYVVTKAQLDYQEQMDTKSRKEIEESVSQEIEKLCIGRWKTKINVRITGNKVSINVEGIMLQSQRLIDNIIENKIFAIKVVR